MNVIVHLVLLVATLVTVLPAVQAQSGNDVPSSPPTIAAPLSTDFTFASVSARTIDKNTRTEIQTAFAVGSLSLVTSASAPLSKSGTTELLSLDDLSTGTIISVSLTRIRWEFGGVEEARARCQKQLNKGDLRDREGDAIVPGQSFEVEGITVQASEVCGEPGGGSRFDLLEEEQERDLTRIVERADQRPLLWEINGKVAQEGANFIDTTAFALQKETRTPFSFGASVGTVLHGGTLIGIGLEYKSSYRASTETEVCVPLGESGSLRCQTGPFGAPTHSDGAILSAQLRRYLDRRIGINPQVRYHLMDNEWSVEAPIYFASNADGGLVGAIIPGYSSEKEDWTLRLVIGAAFGL
jgi:hypothetical protein